MRKINKISTFLLTLFSVLSLSSCAGSSSPTSVTPTEPSINEEEQQIRGIYNLYLENGGTMTYEEWLATIKGEKGDTGDVGPQGEPGKDGTSVLTGNGVPDSNLGKDGDSYIDLNTWDFYVKNNDSWELKGNIKGEDYTPTEDYVGTPGLTFYPINEKECAVSVGTACYLKEVIIPSVYKNYTVTTIIERGFNNSRAESIYFPSSIKNIDENIFDGCPNLLNVYYEGDISDWCEITFKTQYSTNLEQPLHYFLLNNDKYEEMTDVIIPNDVTSIGEFQFFGMSYLNSVTFSSSVKEIGKYAFGYGRLEKVYYKGGVEDWLNINFINEYSNPLYYGEYLYMLDSNEEWKEVTEIVTPDSIEVIKDYAFYGFNNLSSVIFSSKLTTIGASAFAHCISLKVIDIPINIVNIGGQAFYGCSANIFCEALEEQEGWHSSWDGYNNTVFYGMTSKQYIRDEETGCSYLIVDEEAILYSCFNREIEHLYIPSYIDGYPVTSIRSYSLWGLQNLVNIVIGDNIKFIDRNVISGSNNLRYVIISKNVTTINYLAFDCADVTFFCEANSKPEGWDDSWCYNKNNTIYWGDEWSITEDGNYIVLNNNIDASYIGHYDLDYIQDQDSNIYELGSTFNNTLLSKDTVQIKINEKRATFTFDFGNVTTTNCCFIYDYDMILCLLDDEVDIFATNTITTVLWMEKESDHLNLTFYDDTLGNITFHFDKVDEEL